MDHIRKALSFLKARMEKEEEKRSAYFLKNGSLVLEELIASFGGRYRLPIRSFTAKELIRASKNFCEQVPHLVDNGSIYKGNLEGHPVLIKLCDRLNHRHTQKWDISLGAVRDLVISSQMSHLKNVLKLVGCCFEFEYPALVYEYVGTDLLTEYLSGKNDGKSLSWRTRIKIASDIANVVAHLHTAFPTPIIYRDLKPRKVIIDQCGVAKLFDFTLSISLPPGELQVEEHLVEGTFGYIDPEYMSSSIVTQKTDVYGFGMLMLVLFTGKGPVVFTGKGPMDYYYNWETDEQIHLRDYIKGCLDGNAQFNQIVDPNIFEEEINHELGQNMLGCLELALRCTEPKRIDRPDMLDVAKELLHMEKSVRCC